MTDTIRSGLPMVLPESRSEVEILKEQLAVAAHREEAVRIVLRALIASLRPFGFDKKRFKRCVFEEGQDTPNDGPSSIKHIVLNQEARRVLRESR